VALTGATAAIDSNLVQEREREKKREREQELSSTINLWPWRPSRHHRCSN